MNKLELLNLIDSLNLDKNEYYILSSGCLLLYNLREYANDLDLCVSNELFDKLKKKYNLNNPNICGFYKLNELIEIIPEDKNIFKRDFKDGYPVEKLENILKFKQNRNLEKDQNDIKNISGYLKRHL